MKWVRRTKKGNEWSKVWHAFQRADQLHFRSKKTYKTKFPWQSKVNHLVYRLNIKNIWYFEGEKTITWFPNRMACCVILHLATAKCTGRFCFFLIAIPLVFWCRLIVHLENYCNIWPLHERKESSRQHLAARVSVSTLERCVEENIRRDTFMICLSCLLRL